jgi:glycosyltransferase involved in cell wall biosynthesis
MLKISVITVAYNSAATIRDTIASFVAQSHLAKELIVVDGASKDATLAIARSFASPDIRIVSEPDKGPFDAMNKGLARYTGDAVGVLNSDDTFHDSTVLARIAGALETADIAYGDIDMVHDHVGKQVVRAWKAGTYRPALLRWGWMPPHPSLYVRRGVIDRIGNFDISYQLAADYDLVLRALTQPDFRVRYIPEVLADFQLGGLSSRTPMSTIRANLECLRARRSVLGAPPVDLALFVRPLLKLRELRRVDYYKS